MTPNAPVPAHVMYNPGTDRLQVNPDVMVAPKGTAPDLVWNVGANVTAITGIRIRGGWPYGQPTAQPDGSWKTHDPNETKKSYKYDVSATTTAGPKSLDPSIDNDGT